MRGDGSTRPAALRPVGVVLAGGAGRRFGSDKARAELGGQTLVERAAHRLAGASTEILVADRGRRLVAGLASVADGPGAGPAAGVLGAAARRPGRALLVLACDLPAVPAALMAELAAIGGADWVLPRWGNERPEAGSEPPPGPRVEPLCALYRPRALAALAARVAGGEMALHGLLEAELAVRFLEPPWLRRYGEPAELFVNLNRRQDLERFRSRDRV